MTRAALVLVVLAAAMVPRPVSAQTLGTFRWQMRSYCNLLTLTVTQIGGVYRVEGTDDECGTGRDRASVAGLAFPNPDGNIGMGLTIVTPAKGTAVHVTVEISLSSLSGTWRTPYGDSGPFVFTPGTPTPGYPRPLPADGAVPAEISLLPGGSIVARPEGDGGIPASGPGTRMMWYAQKAAFRAGAVAGTQWDDASVGTYSAALGRDARATAFASIALGDNTAATGAASTALGRDSTASGTTAFAVGRSAIASGFAAMALGDNANASGSQSLALGVNTIAGGIGSFAAGTSSVANGHYSVALGSLAATTGFANGSFVFADHSGSNAFTSNAPNEFGARFAGGYYLYTRADLGTGVALGANGSSWAALSDANAKENFREVDGDDLLARLARVPIREWNYKAQDRSIRHMGPTAQDFRAAFGLGDFPLRINTVDADGVALAGVKALEARTRALQDEVETLRRRLDALFATPLRER
jgi:hypothetical protein